MPKRELSIDECEKLLSEAEVGFLAMSRDDEPYCLPFNFVYSRGKVYIHTGLAGRKWEYLTENPRVCLTVAEPGTKKTGSSPCQYTYEFASVIVTGRVKPVTDTQEAAESLGLVIDKYREGPVSEVPAEKMAKLKMVRIDIEKIMGRQNL